MTLRDEHLQIIKSLIEAKNDLLLRELCEQFRERTGISVSVSTMHGAVQKLRLRVKKTLYASEQDTPRVQELRHDYRRSVRQNRRKEFGVRG